MSKPEFMDVAEVRSTLERLGEVVEEFGQREEALKQRYHGQTYHLDSDLQEELKAIDNQLTAALEKCEAAVAERHSALQAASKVRRKRIDRAWRNSRNLLMEDIQRDQGHRVYAAQKSVLQGGRQLDQQLAEVEQRAQEAGARCAKLAQRAADLEKRALTALRAYPPMVREFTARRRQIDESAPAVADGASAAELLDRLTATTETTAGQLKGFLGRLAPTFFRFLPLPLGLVGIALVCGGAVPLFQTLELFPLTYVHAGIAFAALAGLLVAFFFVGRSGATQPAAELTGSALEGRRLSVAAEQAIAAELYAERERIQNERSELSQHLDAERKDATRRSEALKEDGPQELERKRERAAASNTRLLEARLAAVDEAHRLDIERLRGEANARREALTGSRDERSGAAEAILSQGWQQLESEWRAQLPPLFEKLKAASELADAWFPEWSQAFVDQWRAPESFAHAARFGAVHVDVETLAGRLPKDERLALPGDANFTVPMLLGHPEHGSLIIETNEGDKSPVMGALSHLILRLLSVSAPGKASFTIVDPVGLGENFAGVMHLADHEEGIINSRIWTQSAQIEARLGELNDHMEKVIQMYLRNEYETITEYNLKAGNIAEKYHFLVVADFPSGFTDAAAQRLLSIATSGPRCGVFTLVHWNLRQPMPQDFVAAEFREACVRLTLESGGELVHEGAPLSGVRLVLDPPPSDDLVTAFVHKVGTISKDSNRVEVPFSSVTPPAGERWSRTTTHELVVPIGRTGATKFQELAIGKGTRQHALIAGKTGSGKSTLFHVMITNLALWCHPNEIEFYLIDFKKGVEFKSYATARLPHAKVVAIESDREFAESVLTRVDEELKRRGDLFRSLGVQDIAGYQKAGGSEPMPRTLLMIDEFQEFFVEEDRIAQNANVLLDRIVRQGRAFGIHVILGSQTLGGAYTLARTTMGQMVIRIALQCNEADAYLIMDDTNPAPRLLTRPGEGIYNDSAGAVEGNSPFQAVWIDDEERDRYLGEVRALADADGGDFPGPIVFEGNAPADIEDNHLLTRCLEQAPASDTPGIARVWLGAPNSIKGPTEVAFVRQSGCHLLIAGQRDEAALSMITAATAALAAQHPIGGARFLLFDGSAPESPPRRQLEALVETIPHDIELATNRNLGELIADVHAELRRRGDDESASAEAPSIFLFINGLQRLKKLRYEEDFSFSLEADEDGGGGNPGSQLDDIILEGPGVGIHCIVVCDTVNNINRCLSRKAISEFELRVLFQMSANDSAVLIDTPKAANLGLHRALFYNEQEGYLETFRPYALPGESWLKKVASRLGSGAEKVVG